MDDEQRALTELIRTQAGVVTRAQVLAAGGSDAVIRAKLTAGRWQCLHPGTYVTYSGPVTREAQRWAAALYAGPGAVLSDETAAELWGLVDALAGPIRLAVPRERRVRRQPGLVVRRSTRVVRARHPARTPPCTRVEETVVDLVAREVDLDRAVDWLIRACSRRLTTPDRLLRAVRDRRQVRWRRELTEALGDIALGCHSVLELTYLRRVEQAHGLPTGNRQASSTPDTTPGTTPDTTPGTTPGPSRRYDDVRYERWHLVVELDGAAAHPPEGRLRDAQRDNATVAGGHRVLRYGWGDVTDRPCTVAAQIAAVLRRGGWSGAPRRCRPSCRVADLA